MNSVGQNNSSTVSSMNNSNTTQPDIENTAMPEYLELVQTEYQIERGKKESFENRAGIIMALIGALFVFVMEHISFDDIAKLCQLPLTFILLLKIIVGIGAYLLLIVALAFSFFTISTRKQDNYPISAINLAYLAESRANSIARIIMEYRTIILNHRDLNEKRASNFKKSLIFSILSILCLIIYFVF